ncbi:MAG: UDP-N-acetylmuramoyl-L-alanyl-D-glutamate--2,6-diaminopimelate ligase [Phycisphaerae bacterium]|nr:UDP-N-acetylmuramoyl-L-alanyl-D-glutamate--2,6-diaminopimelate ligase [Phycisphaerae bacterium]
MIVEPHNFAAESGICLGDLFARAGVCPVGAVTGTSVSITALVDDSRDVVPGACFVAVRGTRGDAAQYVESAVRAGAAAVVVNADARVEDVSVGQASALIRVADTREAVARMAAAFYGLRDETRTRCDDLQGLKLIGVTGTNGKTTTAWMLQAILRAAGQRPALFGTVGYDLAGRRMDAPLTTPGPVALCRYLAEARAAGATHAVMEVSSHALDQRRTDGLRFSAGVFTNLTGDHLDYHGTFEAYRDAKRRLFVGLPSSAVAVVNAEDPSAETMLDGTSARSIRAGIGCPEADYAAVVEDSGIAGIRLSIRGPGWQRRIHLALVGRFNASNALLASTTAHALGISMDAIVDGLENMRGVPGRLQRAEPPGHPFSVLVDYAHSDDALRNVLSAMRPLVPGRLICVFGCGGDRDRSKRPRMGNVAGELADLVVVTSDNPRSEFPQSIIDQILPGLSGADRRAVFVEPDRRNAIELAVDLAQPGDAVLIAGKGHENYQILADRTISFDDVAVANAAIRRTVVREDVA